MFTTQKYNKNGKKKRFLPFLLYLQSKTKTELLLKSFKQLGELVRAGRGFAATENASESSCGVLHLHAADKSCNSLQIAVAAVLEMYIFDCVSVEYEFNEARAYSLGNSDDFAPVPVFRVRNYFHVVTFINLTTKIQKIIKMAHGAWRAGRRVYAKKTPD